MTDRQAKVAGAWSKAYDEIAEFYPNEPHSTYEALRAFAPAMAGKVDEAEKEAEQASVRWMNGGAGGVQVAINLWRDTWREAVEVLQHG